METLFSAKKHAFKIDAVYILCSDIYRYNKNSIFVLNDINIYLYIFINMCICKVHAYVSILQVLLLH